MAKPRTGESGSATGMQAQLAPMAAGKQFLPILTENGNGNMVVDFQHRANGGVNAHQLSSQIKKGTAGIAAYQRAFGDQKPLFSVRAKPSHSDGRTAFRVKSLGMPQGHHEVTYMQCIGLAQFHMRIGALAKNLHHGGVTGEVGSQDAAFHHAPV